MAHEILFYAIICCQCTMEKLDPMLEFAVVTYGALASFVVASASRNKKQAIANPPILTVFGWGLLSFSGATGTLLIGYAGLKAAGVA